MLVIALLQQHNIYLYFPGMGRCVCVLCERVRERAIERQRELAV